MSLRSFTLPVVALLLGAGLSVATAEPALAATPGGTYVATTPTRVLDTRTGAYGNRNGAVAPDGVTVVKVTGNSGVPTTAAAVVVTISVVSATRSGGITASAYGVHARPGVTNLQFAAGRPATDLALVKMTSGRIDLWNASSGRVQLVADVVGYYAGGTPGVDGSMHLLSSAKRAVDTRTGLHSFHHGAVPAGANISANLHRLAGLPTSAGAVAATVTVVGPKRGGSLVAYATNTTRASAPLLDFAAGRARSQFAVLPLSDVQGLTLHNASRGAVQIVIDVVGYQADGPAAVRGAYQAVAANRIFGDTVVPAHGSDTVQVRGRGGVPKAGVAAVALSVRVSNSARAGTIVGGSHRAPVVVSFAAGERATGEVVARVVNGGVTLRNTSGGSLALEVDVVGYVPAASLSVPAAKSVARYPNDLTSNVSADAATMSSHGHDDATAGATFVLLDLGAQTVHAPLSTTTPGVALTLTAPTVRLSYSSLVTVIKSYIDGLVSGLRHVTLAVATSNDGDWASYGASARGRDFANRLIDPLAAYGAAGGRNVSVVGADDIEANFGSHKVSDALTWEAKYFANTPADLVFNGALNDCPTVFGSTAPCGYGWTQKQYGQLTRHVESGDNRTLVLPQIYFAVQAVQWANVYAHGAAVHFIGSLTQHAADPATYRRDQGWAALVRAVQWRVTSPSVPRAVDIAPDA